MIHPTAADILKTIDATLAAQVAPALDSLDGQSAVATIRHLLRLVLVRIEDEGQNLIDEISALRRLLPSVGDYLRSTGAGMEQRQRIDAALAEAVAGDAGDARYPTLETLAERLSGLREALYQALKTLQALRPERQEQPEYRAIRAAIREYIVWQNEQERKLIAPAFYGQGPRR